jgi:hypothetical protein
LHWYPPLTKEINSCKPHSIAILAVLFTCTPPYAPVAALLKTYSAARGYSPSAAPTAAPPLLRNLSPLPHPNLLLVRTETMRHE